MNSEIAIDEQNLVEDFSYLEKGVSYTTSLFGLVDVEYRIRWIEENVGNIIIDKIIPSEGLKLLYRGQLELHEIVEDHLYNTEGINYRCISFNIMIKEFIDRAIKFGKENFNDGDYFFAKYVWNR